jgi:MFS family permease
MKSNITKIKLISFISELTLYTPVIALYFLDVGLTFSEIVFAQVFYSAGMLLGEIPAGIFSDKFGRKLSVLSGHALDALGILALLILPNSYVLFCINVIRGLGGAFLSGSYEALLYETTAQQSDGKTVYAKTYGSVLSLSTLGFVTASAVSALITSFLGISSYYWLILATACAQILCFAIALSLRELRDTSGNFQSDTTSALTIFQEGVRFVFQNYVTYYLALAALLTINGEYFLRSMYQPLLTDAQLPIEYLGLILTAGALVNIFIVRHIYVMERFVTLPQLLLGIYISTAVGYLLLGSSQNLYVLIGATVFLFGIFNIDRPLISEYINERISNTVRNTALSTVSFAGTIGALSQRIFLGCILSNGGLTTAFVAQASMLLLGTGITFWMMTRCACIHRTGAVLQNAPVLKKIDLTL